MSHLAGDISRIKNRLLVVVMDVLEDGEDPAAVKAASTEVSQWCEQL
jgi:hypothetical protein